MSACRTCGAPRPLRGACPRCGGHDRPGRGRPLSGSRDTLELVAADLREASSRFRVYVLPGADDRLEADYLADRFRRLADRLDVLTASPAGRRLQSARRAPLPRVPRCVSLERPDRRPA